MPRVDQLQEIGHRDHQANSPAAAAVDCLPGVNWPADRLASQLEDRQADALLAPDRQIQALNQQGDDDEGHDAHLVVVKDRFAYQ